MDNKTIFMEFMSPHGVNHFVIFSENYQSLRLWVINSLVEMLLQKRA